MNVVLVGLGAPMAATESIVLAQQPGNGDNGGQGEDFGKSSPVGLLILVLFLIAVALLVRSMTKHLKRVPASFDDVDPKTGKPVSGGEGAESATGAEVKSEAKTEAEGADTADAKGTDTAGATGGDERR